MNISQLLAYGPKLIANPVSARSGEKNGKRYSPRMVERYKSKSINGKIWSTLISPDERTRSDTAARNLKAMANDGILKAVGKVMDCPASNKPILYKWA